MVVVNLSDCEEPLPYMARALNIREDGHVEVHWMRGAYHKAWDESYTGVGRNRKANMQSIPLESILLFGFRLTNKKHLYKETVRQIQQLYANL